MMHITSFGTINRIEGLHYVAEREYYHLIFMNGSSVPIFGEVAHKGLSALAKIYGSDNKNLQSKIRDQRIICCSDQDEVLWGFTPYDQWEGAKMDDGE